ncbi:MAG: RNase adapter RapZ [Lachnospira sp.]|nr:RNase adapter RapZ [Lachnospira sp.]
MKMIIVTGMSGAGKSTALNVLEDEGYYCADNMPISLIPKFAELANAGEDGYSNIAIGVDIRSGHALIELDAVLDDMKAEHYNYTILFLESRDDVLVKRYKETRRTHPLAKDDHDRIDNVIRLEREELKFLKKRADVIIDTSQMLTRELKTELENIFFNDKNFKNLFVTVLSFGFKYGIPADADLVFDVRFLPNPYYVEELKYLTGNDKPVQDYVKKAPEALEFLNKIDDLLRFLLPNYVKEGKNSLVIAIGCTGGKHRSVTLANEIYELLNKTEYGCKVEHRDIEKDSKRKG